MDESQRNIPPNLKPILLSLFIILIGFVCVIYGVTHQLPQTQPNTNLQLNQQSTSSAILTESPRELVKSVKVTRVIDGDTIEIEGGEKVRYIGIDTPETVDPKRPVGCFGKEASDENKRLIENKQVLLNKDTSETDRYGRLLRFVYLDLGDNKTLFINEYLVKNGFAKALSIPPDISLSKQFIEEELIAKSQKIGLWGRCN